LTNFGGYVVVGGTGGRQSALRGVVDWGIMSNVSTRDAIGASVFVTYDEEAAGAGLAFRYRRWMGEARSLELGVGTPLLTGVEEMQTGSVLGLVKWNTSDWFGLVVRPEYIRESVIVGEPAHWRGRVSIGAETGGMAGSVLTGVAGAAVVVILLLVGGSGGN